jgi:hypothetical protein
MIRRPWLVLSLVALVAAASAGAIALARNDGRATAVAPNGARADGLTLFVVQMRAGAFGAVIGSTGGDDAALVLPAETEVTIPGQGEGTIGQALELPAEDARTTVANALGVWVDHYAVLEGQRLGALIDRTGGIPIGDEVLGGSEATGMLEDAGAGGTSAFALVVNGLLQQDVAWKPRDLASADSPSAVRSAFEASVGAPVSALPVSEVATGVVQADPDAVRRTMANVFGGPDRPIVGVIVLNGSGVPGIGALVARRIVPGGFRVVVSENAASFDHRRTLVVVGSGDDVALGERVRDLLGTGTVKVSVSSGIAPVTIVVGKDFEG